MNISELRNYLKELKDEHGDIEVVIDDADTGWLFKIKKVNLSIYKDNRGIHLEIGHDYQNELYK